MLIIIFSIDDIYNIDPQLGQEEDAVTFSIEVATVVTIIFFKPGIADGNTSLSLNTPIARQNPGVTIFRTKRQEVALQATVLNGGVKSKGDAGIAHIVMAVDQIGLEVVDPADNDRVTQDTKGSVGTGAIDAKLVTLLSEVVTHIWRDQEMTPLLVLLLINIPGVQTKVDTRTPC